MRGEMSRRSGEQVVVLMDWDGEASKVRKLKVHCSDRDSQPG